MRFFTIFLLLFFVNIIILPIAHAQSGSYGTGIDANDIELKTNPVYPAPFETVTLRLLSNTVDLNRYRIEWRVNGAVTGSSIGLRDQEITIGGYGSVTTIIVSVFLETQTVQKQLILNPQDSTVLWEAIDSYVPPFYKGKKLPAKESYVKITGIPHFSNITGLTTGNAVYLWDRNGNRILNVGGYGKSSIIIEQNRLRSSELIKVSLSSQDNRYTSEKSIVIPAIQPEINWYTKNEQGYRRLASVNAGATVSGESLTLVAEPYYFSLNNNSLQELVFKWKMGNDQLYLDENAPKNEILINNPQTKGQLGFNVSIENPRTFLQSAVQSLSLLFQPTQ